MIFSNDIKTVVVVSEDSITFKAPAGFLWSTGTSSVGYEVTSIVAAKDVFRILAEPLLKDNR
jgi:hypothetical protein